MHELVRYLWIEYFCEENGWLAVGYEGPWYLRHAGSIIQKISLNFCCSIGAVNNSRYFRRTFFLVTRRNFFPHLHNIKPYADGKGEKISGKLHFHYKRRREKNSLSTCVSQLSRGRTCLQKYSENIVQILESFVFKKFCEAATAAYSSSRESSIKGPPVYIYIYTPVRALFCGFFAQCKIKLLRFFATAAELKSQDATRGNVVEPFSFPKIHCPNLPLH